MCGACGVRPVVDWYAVGVPTDRAGRLESMRRLCSALERLVSGHAGRVGPTLAGTALLVSSPSGASRVVTGAPSAFEALDALFATLRDRDPLAAAASAEQARGEGPSDAWVEVELPATLHWEAFAMWFASIVSARRRELATASALVHTLRGPVLVELVDATIRAVPAAGLSGPGKVRLCFRDGSAAPANSAVLESLDDVTTMSAPGADGQR